MELNFNSVETIPVLNASAAFKTDSGKVFKEDVDIVPVIIDKTLSYVPWGGDNAMPYDILRLIEGDETLATCQMFNADFLLKKFAKFANSDFKDYLCSQSVK